MPPKRKRAAAKDKDEVSLGKMTKETPKSSEAEETTENAQKEKLDYHHWYCELAPRALTAITYQFHCVQEVIDSDSVLDSIHLVMWLATYVDVLHKMYIMIQQIEDLTSKWQTSDKQ